MGHLNGKASGVKVCASDKQRIKELEAALEKIVVTSDNWGDVGLGNSHEMMLKIAKQALDKNASTSE